MYINDFPIFPEDLDSFPEGYVVIQLLKYTRHYLRTHLWWIGTTATKSHLDDRVIEYSTPLKINGWNLTITKLKRNVILNQTSILGVPAVDLLGCN